MRISHSCFYVFGAAVLVALGMALAPSVQARGLPSLLGQGGHSGKKTEKVDQKSLNKSLDQVIQTLENDKQREQLLQQLKTLRKGTKAASETGQSGVITHGALAELVRLFHKNNQNGFVGKWEKRTELARGDMQDLISRVSQSRLHQNLEEIGLWLAVWVAGVLVLRALGRWLLVLLGRPRTLPPNAPLGILCAHFLRMVLPWLVMFVALMWGLSPRSVSLPVLVVVLVLAYICLCGQVLASVFEVVISLFHSGHRRVAIRVLRRVALKPLFIIGVLIALGDAVEGRRLVSVLGPHLSQWLSVVANVFAALISAWLVLRMRRPVVHMIRNRPYPDRRQRHAAVELADFLSGYWHIPALLAIVGSVVAIVVSNNPVHAAFAKAVICAVLLIAVLVGRVLLYRNRDRVLKRLHDNDFGKRVVRFGYALLLFAIWIVFAEIALQVWGFSLLGIGAESSISPRLASALIGVGITVLIAWLVWILVDTAISRALRGKTLQHRTTSTRAKTVAPMIRNLAFFTILVIAAVVAIANLGVNVTPLLAGAGVIGLAVGFGAQTLVQDLITGVFILVEDSMAVGDFVEINGFMGTVEGLNLRTVRLRDLDAVVHYVTFSHIQSIHNMSRGFGTTMLKIRIPHDMPIDDAIKLMQDTAAELRRDPWMKRMIRSPLEMQGIHSFEEGCPILRMRMYTEPEYQWNVARAFNLLLKRKMEKQEITLGAPRMSISMSGGGGQYYTGKGKPVQGPPGGEAAQPGSG